MEVLVLFVC